MITASRFKSPIVIPSGDSRIKFRWGMFDDPRIRDFIALGMPDDDERVSIQWAGVYFDNQFQGYALELFGVDADFEPSTRDILLVVGAATPHHVVYERHSRNFVESGGFYVWACRVYRPDGKVVAEEIWNPKLGWVPMTNNIWVQDSEIARHLVRSIENEEPPNTIIGLKEPKKGRPTGSGYFANQSDFLAALKDILPEIRNPSQPTALHRLSTHKLWKKKPLTLKECQNRTKTLRNWLADSDLTWDQAKERFCGENQRGK